MTLLRTGWLMPWPLAIVSTDLALAPPRASSWLSDLLDADPERRAERRARLHDPESTAAHQGVRGRCHGLERDKVLARRREDLRVGVAAEHLDGHAKARAREGEDRSLVEENEPVVEARLTQLAPEPREGRLCPRRDPLLVQGQPPHGGKVETPAVAWELGQPEIRMKPEAHRYGPLGAGLERGLQGEAVGAKGHGELEPMRVREQREQLGAIPVQTGSQGVRRRRRHLPGEARPRHAVNRKPMLLGVEQRRRQIERRAPPCGAIGRASETIRPRMQKRNARRAALGRGGVQVVHAAQQLHVSVTERRAEHPVARKEHRLQAPCDEGASTCLAEDRRGTQSYSINRAIG